MPYTLIKGEFIIHYPDNPRSGPEPDGDTLKFRPFNRILIDNLPRSERPPRFTQSGITTLRFEGIDALETHFPVDGNKYHQHMELALEARDVLLQEMGFGEVEYFEDLPFKVRSVRNHPILGYILSNGVDPYGRSIAFVFKGDTDLPDGARVWADKDHIANSMNQLLLQKGMAYPSFYITLPADLREFLKETVKEARSQSIGLWGRATATPRKFADIPALAPLQELVIWPKLFRRLVAYYEEGFSDLSGFESWLREDSIDRDDRLILPNQELGNMHDILTFGDNSSIKLNTYPENVVMVPDNYSLPQPPQPPQIPVGKEIRILAALVDGKGNPEKELVTILNTTNRTIPLKGWKLADLHGEISLGGDMLAGGVLQIKLDQQVKLNNTRDTLTLLNGEGKIEDQVSYEKKELPKEEGYTHVFFKR